MNQILDFIKERYNFESPEIITNNYINWLKEHNFNLYTTDYGFLTYKFQGDACIINDIFVNKENRSTKKTWELFNWIRTEAQNNKNCNVLIGFIELLHSDSKHDLRIQAMKSAGFKEFIKDTELSRLIYIRGVQ